MFQITFKHTPIAITLGLDPATAAAIDRLSAALAAGNRDDGAITDSLSQITSTLSRLEQKMSALEDAVAALEASTDAVVARVQADHDALSKQISDLQAQLDAGGLTQAQEDALAARLAALQAKQDAIDPTNPATLPPDTGTPPDQTQPPAPDQGGAPA
jgi:septal ring factor EnvC (AmiA/AmiB activator)